MDKLGREQDALDRSSQVVQAHYSVIQSLNKVIAEGTIRRFEFASFWQRLKMAWRGEL